jgi:exonuclease VII large subunit
MERLMLGLLLISGGVGVAIGAIAAGLYCRSKYKQKIEDLKQQLASLQGNYIKTERERKTSEAQYTNLKQNYSNLENKQHDLEREFNQLQRVHQQFLDRQNLESTSRYPTVESTSKFPTISEASLADSSMQKLLQAYQINSKSLLITAKVTEASESIDQRRNNPSLAPSLVESGNFDYLIVQDQDNASQYWLFPKHGLKVNQYAFETVQALFNCHNYQNQPSNFQVHQPASVTRNPASSSWQLAEKGEIEFI